MIDVINNISGYFDEDFENIIYKDLRTNGLSDEEVEKLLNDKYRDLPMMEENLFKPAEPFIRGFSFKDSSLYLIISSA